MFTVPFQCCNSSKSSFSFIPALSDWVDAWYLNVKADLQHRKGDSSFTNVVNGDLRMGPLGYWPQTRRRKSVNTALRRGWDWLSTSINVSTKSVERFWLCPVLGGFLNPSVMLFVRVEITKQREVLRTSWDINSCRRLEPHIGTVEHWASSILEHLTKCCPPLRPFHHSTK